MSNKLCQKSAYVNTLPSNTVHVGKVHKERHCTGEQCAELGSLNRPCLHLKQAFEVVNQKKLTNVIVQIAAGDYTDTDKDLEIPSAIRKIEGAGREVTMLGSGLKATSELSICKLSIGTDPRTKALEFAPGATNTARVQRKSALSIEMKDLTLAGYTGIVNPDATLPPLPPLPPIVVIFEQIQQELGVDVSNLWDGSIVMTIKNSNFVKNGGVSAAGTPFNKLQNAARTRILARDNSFQHLAGNPVLAPVVYAYGGEAPAGIASDSGQYVGGSRLAHFDEANTALDISSRNEEISDETPGVDATPFFRVKSHLPDAPVTATINNLTSTYPLTVADLSGAGDTTLSARDIYMQALADGEATTLNQYPLFNLQGITRGVLQGIQTPQQMLLFSDSAPSGEMSTITVTDAIVKGLGKVKGANFTASEVVAKASGIVGAARATAPPKDQIPNKFENCNVRIDNARFENSARVFKNCPKLAESNVSLKNSTTSGCLDTVTSPSYKVSLARIEDSTFNLDDGFNFELSTSDIRSEIQENIPIIVEPSTSIKSGLISVINTKIDHNAPCFLKFLEGVKDSSASFGTTNIKSNVQCLVENHPNNNRGILKFGALVLNKKQDALNMNVQEEPNRITEAST
jgi:hypothetical protein